MRGCRFQIIKYILYKGQFITYGTPIMLLWNDKGAEVFVLTRHTKRQCSMVCPGSLHPTVVSVPFRIICPFVEGRTLEVTVVCFAECTQLAAATYARARSLKNTSS